jgi:hydroxylamine reductase
MRNDLLAEALKSGWDGTDAPGAAAWNPASEDEYPVKAAMVGVLSTENEDIRSLRELVIYGLKGLAAYTEHAEKLGREDEALYEFARKALPATLDDDMSVDTLTALVLETGEKGVTAMALLDEANTRTYGNPEISEVNLGVGDRPGILVSGHDLRDLKELLDQTVDAGIDIYTHGEMLPAHYYPELKAYSHLKETTVRHGGTRQRNSIPSTVPSCSPQTVWFLRNKITSTASSPPVLQVSPASFILPTGREMRPKISRL